MNDTLASLHAQAAALAAEFPSGVERAPMAIRAGPTAEISIEGVVGLDVTLGGFRAALRSMSDDAPLLLRVNSPGGSVFDGFGIFNLLAQRKGPVTARIDGQAASAASYIVMAASRVEMPAASLLMIHNASSFTIGTKEDHEASIGILSKIDALMARIYAARTGRTTEDVEALMEAETWFTGEEAIVAGFADALIDSPVAGATALSLDARRLLAGFKSLPAKIAAMATTAAPPVAAPPTTEVQMDVQNTPGGVAASVTNPIAASAVELAQIARRANLGPEWIETQALASASLVAAQGNALDAMAAAAAAAVTTSPVTAPRIEILSDARETMRARMQSAIVCSIRCKAPKEAPAEAREFLNVGIVGMMRETLALAGDKTAHRLDNAALWERVVSATGGTHTSSDFPLILRDAANVALQIDFGEFPKTFEAWASDTDVSDFKQINSAQIGSMPTLSRVAEGQPVPYRPIAEEGESYKVDTYAGIVAMTREMIINDRLNAFGRVVREAAAAAERALSDLVYFQVTNNANMADGNRLFSSAHLNVGTGSSGTDYHYLFASDRPTVEVAYLSGRRSPEITEETQFNVLGVAYRVLFDFGAKAISWRGVTRERALVNVDGSTVAPLEQLLLTMREVGGSLIGVPRNLVLLVPPAQHFAARRLVTAVTPTQASNVNIYGGLQLVVEPRLGNTTVV
jgi:ATP-dependent protease ClpP protease subunit/phage major head subunit gpT-like protein